MTEAARRAALEAAGAAGTVVDELLAYGAPLIPPEKAGAAEGSRFGFASAGALDLPDEPQLEAWSAYSAAAGSSGAFETLSQVFPQLRFPVRQGISESESYRAATRRGASIDDDEEATGLRLSRPELVTLGIYPTLAGSIPILVAGERSDFEALTRAFSARNEPVDVPPSMGACLVRGLNNWDRIRRYRRKWETANPDGDWDEEFRALIPRKEQYEDRFILLSSGPYSGVPAADAGFGADEWKALSLSIRREHEATHFFTLRAAGTMRNNLIDELLADYVGLVRTFGRYREDLALLFFGLEAFPSYREGGRLQNYRGKPPLSDAAFEVAKRLTHGAVKGLARLDASLPPLLREGAGLARLMLALMTLSLEELGGDDLSGILAPAGVERLSLRIPNDQIGVAAADEEFEAFARRVSLQQKAVSDILLVLDELISNKLKYAWDDGETHKFDVDFTLAGGVLELQMVDDGKEFDPIKRIDPDTTGSIREKPVGGLGILLVKRLTDEQRYRREDGKNVLLLRKKV